MKQEQSLDKTLNLVLCLILIKYNNSFLHI